MIIKELYYINEQGFRVGPIPFDKIKSLQIKPDTYVWFDGIGNDWRRASDVEEIKQIFTSSKPSSPTPPPVPADAPKPFTPPQPDKQESTVTKPEAPKLKKPLSDKDKKVRMFILIFGVVFGLIATAVLLIPIPMIASAFNGKPIAVGSIFGALILILYLIAGIVLKSKRVLIPLIAMGVLFGGAQSLISFLRFDDGPNYSHGYLRTYSNGTYNSLGFKILPYGNDFALASSPWGDIVLEIRYYNNELIVKGYNDSGNSVFYESLPCYGYEDTYFGNLPYSDQQDIVTKLENYLSEEHSIYIYGTLYSSNIKS